MKRRGFILGASLALPLLKTRLFAAQEEIPLPSPVYHNIPARLSLNSRYSVHGGWQWGSHDQQMSNLLYGLSKLPWGQEQNRIFIADERNVFKYNPANHSLIVHLAGDKRTSTYSAFEMTVLGTELETTASLNLAQMLVTGFWTNSQSNSLASCPCGGALPSQITKDWQLPSDATQVFALGFCSIKGLNPDCVAHSSDASLPDPETTGGKYLEKAAEDMKKAYTSKFKDIALSKEDISNILWSGYGVVPHYAFNNYAGLTVASSHAAYYITPYINLATKDGFYNYFSRPKNLDLTKRDHRIALLKSGDYSSKMRSIISRLPANAYAYVLLSIPTANKDELGVRYEAGGFASNLLLQASVMDLGCYFTLDLSDDDRTKLYAGLPITQSYYPVAILSVGVKDSGGFNEHGSSKRIGDRMRVYPNPFRDKLFLSLTEEACIFNALGQLVIQLDKGDHELNTSTWQNGVYLVQSGRIRKRVVRR